MAKPCILVTVWWKYCSLYYCEATIFQLNTSMFKEKMLLHYCYIVTSTRAESPGSNFTISMHFCPSTRQFESTLLLSTQAYKWGPSRMRQMIVFEFASAIIGSFRQGMLPREWNCALSVQHWHVSNDLAKDFNLNLHAVEESCDLSTSGGSLSQCQITEKMLFYWWK